MFASRTCSVDPKDPQSPEFWIGPTITTLGALLDDYLVSPQFNGLAEGSRSQYGRWSEAVRSAWGNHPTAALRPVHVRTFLDELGDKQGMANNILGFLRGLSSWALSAANSSKASSRG
jgi:hypothetical protein